MVSWLIIILMVLLVVAIFRAKEAEPLMASIVGLVALAVVIAVGVGSTLYDSATVSDKIIYLESYNETIDSDIKDMVLSYQGHESDLLKREVSATVLVEMYPDLKSNELVSKQLDIYMQNQLEIKELEMKRIDLKATQKIWYLW